ncbi:MAG: hypothetical protein LBP50_08380 [Tannerella sp.]|nr:hypothetical protein [Tannerella sp.]
MDKQNQEQYGIQETNAMRPGFSFFNRPVDKLSLEEDNLFLEEGKLFLEEDKLFLEEEKLFLEEDKLSLEEDKLSLEEEKLSLEEEKLSLEEEKPFLEEEKPSPLKLTNSPGQEKNSTVRLKDAFSDVLLLIGKYTGDGRDFSFLILSRQPSVDSSIHAFSVKQGICAQSCL